MGGARDGIVLPPVAVVLPPVAISGEGAEWLDGTRFPLEKPGFPLDLLRG